LNVHPDIDLFASRLNYQLKPYVVLLPDPGAYAVDCFSVAWKEYDVYAFPPFSLIPLVLQNVEEEGAAGIIIVPHWTTQTLWPRLMRMLIDFLSPVTQGTENLGSSQSTSGCSSTSQNTNSGGMPLIGQLFEGKGLSKRSTDIITSSWRTSTKKQYSTYLRQWEAYCRQQQTNPLHASVVTGIDFLAELSVKCGYSAVNTARSALSSVLILPEGKTFGEHPLVCRFMKGLFELKPTLPRYSEIWDPEVVLEFLRNWKTSELFERLNYETSYVVGLGDGPKMSDLEVTQS